MPTIRQLAIKGRSRKRRRCTVAALKGAPQRKAVVVKMGTTTPKKPNSAKRRFVKVAVLRSKKIIFAYPPGNGKTFIQDFSTVMIEGGGPPDVPGINYSLIRGVYDFAVPEEIGRTRKRSKYGTYKYVPERIIPTLEAMREKYEERKRLKLEREKEEQAEREKQKKKIRKSKFWGWFDYFRWWI